MITADLYIPWQSFLYPVTVVTRRIPQRFFRQTEDGFLNPVAGTVIDNTLTKMEFADFYLVSQSVNQVMSVSPPLSTLPNCA